MSPASHYQFSACLTAIVNLVLLWLVISKGTNKKLVRAFVFYCSAIIFWSFFVALSTTVRDPALSLLFSQFCHVGATLIPLFFLHFIYAFLMLNEKSLLVRVLNVIAILFLNVILFFPAIFFNGVSPKFGFPFFPNAGKLYLIWTIYFFTVVGFGHIQLLRASLKLEGVKKKRLIFFFLANLVGYSGGIGCFLPVYNVSCFPFPYGAYGVVLFSLVTAYSIFMYSFLDIEVILKKTIVFAGIVTAAVSIIAFPFTLIQVVIGGALGVPHPLVIMLLGIVTSVLIYHPVERILVNLTDKYFFQKKFDYRRVLQTASEGLANINSLDHQLRLVAHFLTMRVRIKSVAIYMPENGNLNFVLKSVRPTASFKDHERIAFDSPILLYLKAEKEKKYLEYYSVENAMRKYKNTAMFSYDLPKMLEEMKRLNARLVVPSFYQDQLQGILVLGERKSDETYSEEDIQVFQTIAQESAIAFENARKHDEIVEKNQKLEEMNEALRKSQEEVIQIKQESAVAQLSGGISHEVKNAILALAEAIEQINATVETVSDDLGTWYESGEPVPEYQKEDLFRNLKNARYFLNQAKQTSRHIEGVVQTLSQMSKGKHAQMTMMSVKSFLLQMISIGMLRTYGDRVRTQALEEPPKLEVASDLPLIHANAHLLRAVFMNFFKNSIYAMDHICPKKITIRAMMDPEMKDMVRIEFEDNGKGIPPEILPKIFDYGFTTKGAEGEGKGLYNVKSMIEGEHHGAISVQSEVGKGTTFILKLPTYRFDDEKE